MTDYGVEGLVEDDDELVGVVVITATEDYCSIEGSIAEDTELHPATYAIRMLATLLGHVETVFEDGEDPFTREEIFDLACEVLDDSNMEDA